MKKLFFITLSLFAYAADLVLLAKYIPKADAAEEVEVRISDVKISRSIDDAAVGIYEVRIAVAEKGSADIKLARACFTKDFNFCTPVIERGGEAVTWINIGTPATYKLSVFLEYEYVVAGEKEPVRGKSNEVITTVTARR